VLFRVVLPIKLLEFLRLVATRHVERINSLGVTLVVKVNLARTSAQLNLNYSYNEVLDLLDGHQAWRPTILEFTAIF